jgi:hypothetical protein
MSCCPSAEFTIMPNGIEAKENNIQADAVTRKFFPFSAIRTISYSDSKGDGLVIMINTKDWTNAYHFPCSAGGLEIYMKLIAAIP